MIYLTIIRWEIFLLLALNIHTVVLFLYCFYVFPRAGHIKSNATHFSQLCVRLPIRLSEWSFLRSFSFISVHSLLSQQGPCLLDTYFSYTLCYYPLSIFHFQTSFTQLRINRADLILYHLSLISDFTIMILYYIAQFDKFYSYCRAIFCIFHPFPMHLHSLLLSHPNYVVTLFRCKT